MSRRTRIRHAFALLAVSVTAGVAAGSADAAAPRIVIFSGAPLAHQVVISNWLDIFHVVEDVASRDGATPLGTAGRPRLRFSMFWGPRWIDYLRSGRSPAALRPAQADQHGTFYPAWHGRPALLDLPWAGRWPRVVPARALAILARHGVPVRL